MEVINLVDKCFPGMKACALQAEAMGVKWADTSRAFIAKEGGQLVAHVGVLSAQMVVCGRNCNCAGIHAVCTEEHFRRRGHFTQLMREALEYVHKNYECAILFTDHPEIYYKFGFSVLDEYEYIFTYKKTHPQLSNLKKLSLSDSSDLDWIKKMVRTRIPVSMVLGALTSYELFIYNILSPKVLDIFYSEEYEFLICYHITGNRLVISDVIASEVIDFESIVCSIPDPFEEVEFKFIPDRFNLRGVRVEPHRPEDAMMVDNRLPFEDLKLRMPVLAKF